MISADGKETFYQGINLPQAGFGAQHIPGVAGKDYSWPTTSDVNLYADMGANILRISFLWERMQPHLNMPLEKRELAHLDALVAAAASRKATILMDVHNYGFYNKRLISFDAIPIAAFADLWTRLAAHYKDKPFVAFGPMNEPYRLTAEERAPIKQQIINAIRETGASQLILVPGTHWSGAHSWTSKDGRLSNAEALANFTDPAHHFIFEAHEYFDVDSSGTHPACVSEDVGPPKACGNDSMAAADDEQGIFWANSVLLRTPYVSRP